MKYFFLFAILFLASCLREEDEEIKGTWHSVHWVNAKDTTETKHPMNSLTLKIDSTKIIDSRNDTSVYVRRHTEINLADGRVIYVGDDELMLMSHDSAIVLKR